MDVAIATSAVSQSYLSQPGVKKLHLGAGHNVIAGWLNTDLEPSCERVERLDLTGTFPYEDASFDYVFSEHVIEHVPYAGGLNMLRESFRVLRPGGRIRISTPDLGFVVGLYRPEKSPLQSRYIRWATATFVKGAPYCADVFVINNFVRDWGHTFIYDPPTLTASMHAAGFSEIRRYDLNESQDVHLQRLENEKRLPPDFLRLETFTLEAVKGAVAPAGVQ